MLAAIAGTGNISKAATVANVARAQHYAWLKQDPEYAQAVQDAMEQAADALESEARRRAEEGVDEPVFYKGKECGVIRKYSDTLLIFLLKGGRPERYRERHEVTGKDGAPFSVSVTLAEG